MTDYYNILGVEKTATADQIKAAYRKLALEYHPDRNKSPEAEAKFKEINEAYDHLSDTQKRQTYDNRGRTSWTHPNGWPGMSPQWDGIIPMKGEKIQRTITIDLKTVLMGGKVPLRYHRYDTCQTCHGGGLRPGGQRTTCKGCNGTGSKTQHYRSGNTEIRQAWPCQSCKGRGKWVAPEDCCKDCYGRGEVANPCTVDINVPPGIDGSVEIAVRGQGNIGKHGGPRGDVFVRCQVERHERFQRDGIDLHAELPISYVQACLGAKVEVELLDGTKQPVNIPSNWNGTEIVVEGKGLKDLRSIVRGKLRIRIRVKTPPAITEEYRLLLQRMAELEKNYDAQDHQIGKEEGGSPRQNG